MFDRYLARRARSRERAASRFAEDPWRWSLIWAALMGLGIALASMLSGTLDWSGVIGACATGLAAAIALVFINRFVLGPFYCWRAGLPSPDSAVGRDYRRRGAAR